MAYRIQAPECTRNQAVWLYTRNSFVRDLSKCRNLAKKVWYCLDSTFIVFSLTLFIYFQVLFVLRLYVNCSLYLSVINKSVFKSMYVSINTWQVQQNWKVPRQTYVLLQISHRAGRQGTEIYTEYFFYIS